MKYMKRIILIAGFAFSACGVAQSATLNATGCPTGAWTTWHPGQQVSISWSFQGIGPVVAFHPTGLVFGGGLAPLTPAQAAAYAPALDDLRAAAQARRKVTVAWDSATNAVSTLIVRWNQPC